MVTHYYTEMTYLLAKLLLLLLEREILVLIAVGLDCYRSLADRSSPEVLFLRLEERVRITRQNASNDADLQYACILIIAFLALPFLAMRPPLGPAFLTPAVLAGFGVAVLVVVAAMTNSRY